MTWGGGEVEESGGDVDGSVHVGAACTLLGEEMVGGAETVEGCESAVSEESEALEAWVGALHASSEASSTWTG